MATITRLDVGARMSEASVFNGIIHLAGQVADDASGDMASQTAQVLAAVDKLLLRCGSDKSRILMMQIYLKDVTQFAAMNAVYDSAFTLSWLLRARAAPLLLA
jgi:enamine deaminase RidA (YjgF/YER057c/UK114 family)